MGDFVADLGQTARRAGRTAKDFGRAAQDIGRAAGDVTGADDQYRRTNGNHETAGNQAEIRARRTGRTVENERAIDVGQQPPYTPQQGGYPVHGHGNSAYRQNVPTNPLVDFSNAVAIATKYPSPQNIQIAVSMASQLPRGADGLFVIPPGTVRGGIDGTKTAVQFDQSDRYKTPEAAVLAVSKILAKQVGTFPLGEGQLGIIQPQIQPIIPAPAATAAPAPAAPVVQAPSATTPGTTIVNAVRALQTGAEISLDGLRKSPEGLYVLPKGDYPTGELGKDGNPITLKIKEDLQLNDGAMRQALTSKLKEAGIDDGRPQRIPATFTSPALNEPKTREVVFMSASGADAKLYKGTAGQEVPADQAPKISENQVKALQILLGVKPEDGKYGPQTHAAFVRQCTAAGVNPANVDFTTPRNANLVTLLGHMNPQLVREMPTTILLEASQSDGREKTAQLPTAFSSASFGSDPVLSQRGPALQDSILTEALLAQIRNTGITSAQQAPETAAPTVGIATGHARADGHSLA